MRHPIICINASVNKVLVNVLTIGKIDVILEFRIYIMCVIHIFAIQSINASSTLNELLYHRRDCLVIFRMSFIVNELSCYTAKF